MSLNHFFIKMKNTDTNLREYNFYDKEQVIELLRLNTPTYFAPEEENDFINYLDNHIESYYVIELDNQLVACGGFNASDKPAQIRISWDIIHPNYQGKGLGSQLLQFRIQEIKKIIGIEIISVRTSQIVYPFYAKYGFKLKEIVKDYWAKGFDLYSMESMI